MELFKYFGILCVSAVTLSGKKDTGPSSRRRRKPKEGDDMDCESGSEGSDDEGEMEVSYLYDDKKFSPYQTKFWRLCPLKCVQDLSKYYFQVETPTVTTISDDGVFTVTVGPALTQTTSSDGLETGTSGNIFVPSPRSSCGLVVKHGVLYLFGGMKEDGNRQFTYNDFYSLGRH